MVTMGNFTRERLEGMAQILPTLLAISAAWYGTYVVMTGKPYNIHIVE